MASLAIGGPESTLPTPLQETLLADAIVPGSAPSYELCKILYEYHPIGKRMVDNPIALAQCQVRKISIPKGPEERCREVFLKEWERIGADGHIAQTYRLARMYGIASIAMLVRGMASDTAIADYGKLAKAEISFNCYDPLNTAGSLVLNQMPNAMDFMKTQDIRVQGDTYHRSRVCIILHEDPVYISYTTSAFGFVGRSVYQRALFPLKSFVQTMIANDMVARKVGLLIAKTKPPGSIIDKVMLGLAAAKRALLQQGKTDNVLMVDREDEIETINLQNLDAPLKLARTNILEDIASSADMPAILLRQDTFTEGFGEGSEDAKMVARYVDRERRVMQCLYAYFDKIVMHRAWNEDFYKTIQADFPEYRHVSFKQAFMDWSGSFAAEWPSLLTEPESEMVKVDEVKMNGCIALLEMLTPLLDPINQAIAIEWAIDNFNERKMLFTSPLILDMEALEDYREQKAEREEESHEAEITPPQPQGGVNKNPLGGKGGKGGGRKDSVRQLTTLLNRQMAQLQGPGTRHEQ